MMKIRSLILQNPGIKKRSFWIWLIYKRLKIFFRNELPLEDVEALHYISEYIHKGDTVLDIGANVGLWSGRLSKLVGKKGHVFAFEPVQITYEKFNKLIGNSKIIKVYNFALSDNEDIVEFMIPRNGFSKPTSFIPETAQHLTIVEKDYTKCVIPKFRLDTKTDELGIQSCSFVKCDVEGHELEVMKGATNFLQRFKPVIYLEITREKWLGGDPLKSVVSGFLGELGYTPYQVSQGKATKKFRPEKENFLFFFESANKHLKVKHP